MLLVPDGWGDSSTYGSDAPAPQSFALDTGGGGYNSNPCFGSAYSAYVSDHGIGLINYAFLLSNVEVPEPATLGLLGAGLAGLGFARRRKAA